MPKVETEIIVIINPEVELPIYITDEFLNKTIEVNPTGEMSSLKVKTLTETYPNLYRKYVPNDLIEVGDTEITLSDFVKTTAWKKRPNYRIDELETEFEKLSSEQRDIVLGIIKGMLNPNILVPDTPPKEQKPKADTKVKEDFDDL